MRSWTVIQIFLLTTEKDTIVTHVVFIITPNASADELLPSSPIFGRQLPEHIYLPYFKDKKFQRKFV